MKPQVRADGKTTEAAGPAARHLPAVLHGVLHSPAPEGGLADSGGTLDEKRAGPSALLEKRGDRLKLLIAPDDLSVVYGQLLVAGIPES